MAALTANDNIRTILLDVAKEEKTHVGEFQALLLEEDKEQERELKEGERKSRSCLKNGNDRRFTPGGSYDTGEKKDHEQFWSSS